MFRLTDPNWEPCRRSFCGHRGSAGIGPCIKPVYVIVRPFEWGHSLTMQFDDGSGEKMCIEQVRGMHCAIRKLLSDLNGISTTFVRQKMPDPTAAGDGEKPNLPFAHLAP